MDLTQGRYLELIDCCNELIRIRPEDFIAYWYKSKALYNLERNIEGLEILNQAIQTYPSNSTLFCYRANFFNILDREAEALQDFNKAHDLTRENLAEIDNTSQSSWTSNEDLYQYQAKLIFMMFTTQENVIELKKNFQNLKANFEQNPELLKNIEEKEEEIKKISFKILENLVDYLSEYNEILDFQEIEKEVAEYKETVSDLVAKL